MPLSAEDLEHVRDYVSWTPPTDDDLHAAYDELGEWQAVAYRFTRRRLSELLGAPASFTVPGMYSEDNGPNITALGKSLGELQPSGAPGPAPAAAPVTTRPIYRPDAR